MPTAVQRLRGLDPPLGPPLLAGVLRGALAALPVVLLLALVRTSWQPLQRLDLGTAGALHGLARESAGLVRALDVVAAVFSPTVFQVAVGAAVIWLVSRRAYRLAAWAAVTMYGGAALSPLLKALVARARPVLEAPVANAPGYSFPSGHALDSLLGSVVLLVIARPLLSRRWWAAAVGAGVVVVAVTGFDRIALGVHYVSDVVAGWLVATAVLTGTGVGFERWRRSAHRRPDDPLGGLVRGGERELGEPRR